MNTRKFSLTLDQYSPREPRWIPHPGEVKISWYSPPKVIVMILSYDWYSPVDTTKIATILVFTGEYHKDHWYNIYWRQLDQSECCFRAWHRIICVPVINKLTLNEPAKMLRILTQDLFLNLKWFLTGIDNQVNAAKQKENSLVLCLFFSTYKWNLQTVVLNLFVDVLFLDIISKCDCYPQNDN